MAERSIIGWDIGGAHVKACRVEHGALSDVALWACPLWQGLDRLEAAFAAARARWSDLERAHHAVTMTGELADCFADREDGVRRIAACSAAALGAARLRFFVADDAPRWCARDDVAREWPRIASANWLASAQLAARRVGTGLFVDIGSTTTDIVALTGGRVASASRSDAERLESFELVYQGVVRTPLMGVARRIAFRGRDCGVMNELFASAADVYRATGELDPDDDLYPSADGAPKDAVSTRRRLARMIGLDARDAAPEDWLAFAHAWRGAQLAEIGAAIEQVARAQGVARDAPLVAAGCGDFLVAALAAASGRPLRAYAASGGDAVVRVAPDALARRAGVCAAALAVALWFDEELNASCG